MNIKDKIQKLLALAESPNEHEAKAALLKARQLMAEHKLLQKDLEDVSHQDVKVIETFVSCTKRTNPWITSLSNIIASNYCCQALSSRTPGSRTYNIRFVGLENDVDICNSVFLYAVDCVMTKIQELKKRYAKLKRHEQTKIANGYGQGFVRGLREAFEQQQQEKESEWGLIMQQPKEVTEYCQDFNVIDFFLKHPPISLEEYSNGYQDGQKFAEQKRIQG